MKTVRFYIKVLKNYDPPQKGVVSKLIFRTQEFNILHSELPEFLKLFKSTIRKDCSIFLHPVKIEWAIDIRKTKNTVILKKCLDDHEL